MNLFSPFGWIFGGIVAARREFYRRNWLKSHDLGVPVVSVGNLTVGGTGKTPLVAFIARILAENNHKVGVLTRGYKRADPNERVVVSDGKGILADAKAAGDEPFELAHKLLGAGAAVIADKRRADAGMWARRNLGVTAFVLDDGFQHWQIKRDADIVCVDATNPFGNGELLPAGILREPLTSLQRADCIVLTRTDLISDSRFQIPDLKAKIEQFTSCSILSSKTKIIGLRELKENLPAAPNNESEIQNPKSKTALAFSGLGNPANFFETLRRADFAVAGTKIFPDHFAYAPRDAAEIEKAAQAAGAAILLTTAKDAVKLTDLKFSLPCFVVEIEMVFDDDQPLRELLAKL